MRSWAWCTSSSVTARVHVCAYADVCMRVRPRAFAVWVCVQACAADRSRTHAFGWYELHNTLVHTSDHIVWFKYLGHRLS